MAVTGIATVAYLGMTVGAGVSEVDGRDVYWMRYIDWFFTTPFFLLDLALLAGADTWDTFYVMLLNAMCIASGAVGALTPAGKIPMFMLGMITFCMFNYVLFGAMMKKADSLGSEVGGKYKLVTTVTMIVWCAYPMMYVLCEMMHAVNIEMEVVLYAGLDVFAKCVMSFVLLGNHDVLQAVNQAQAKLLES